ncbi:hypothetical protein NC651_009804 [Populus alba x Populus x berolinensis]|nr:hypothetical protein NC651_009804 [Populus alba x Populus x berolinensis]
MFVETPPPPPPYGSAKPRGDDTVSLTIITPSGNLKKAHPIKISSAVDSLSHLKNPPLILSIPIPTVSTKIPSQAAVVPRKIEEEGKA